jgi:hypothetical protein
MYTSLTTPSTNVSLLNNSKASNNTQSNIVSKIQKTNKKEEKMEKNGDLSDSENFESESQPDSDSVPIVPKCDELYISTKTKVLFLNQEIDIDNVFWNIDVIEYWRPTVGVIKKQMKIVSKTPEEYEHYRKKLENINYYTEHIIKQIDNPNARRIKYKDERKITIGISKKDIMNCRGKVKNAFYNCFAMILRIQHEGNFREIHVKVFNTGKMEIPGVLNISLLNVVKEHVLNIIQPLVEKPLSFVETDVDENVLINSNFNCGFYIDREKLHNILSNKYGIETSYDPCSYPGVKCKYYFNNTMGYCNEEQSGNIKIEDRTMKMSELEENQTYTDVSFMIFRTGSCLIVGNCSEKILVFIFEYIKKILHDEYANICVHNEDTMVKRKKIKLRKRTIHMSSNYYETIAHAPSRQKIM